MAFILANPIWIHSFASYHACPQETELQNDHMTLRTKVYMLAAIVKLARTQSFLFLAYIYRHLDWKVKKKLVILRIIHASVVAEHFVLSD
jgi:hypothetical protein